MNAVANLAGQATTYAFFAKRLFEQTNPLQSIVAWFTTSIYTLANYRSNIKLNKYRQSLYAQQLARMENYLDQGSPYAYNNGRKFNRKY